MLLMYREDDPLHAEISDIAAALMTRAVVAIDKQFGDGYAKQNPALVGAYMETAVKLVQRG